MKTNQVSILGLVTGIALSATSAFAGHGQNECTKQNAKWEADRCAARVHLAENVQACCKEVEARDYNCGINPFAFNKSSFIMECTDRGEENLSGT